MKKILSAGIMESGTLFALGKKLARQGKTKEISAFVTMPTSNKAIQRRDYFELRPVLNSTNLILRTKPQAFAITGAAPPKQVGKKLICVKDSNNFGVWLKVGTKGAIITATADVSSELVSFSGEQRYPIWAPASSSYDLTSGAAVAAVASVAAPASVEAWYYLTAAVGDANSPDRGVCVHIDGDALMFENQNALALSGWRTPAFLENYYLHPIDMLLVVPSNTEATITLSPNDAFKSFWFIDYKAQEDSSFSKEKQVENEAISVTMPMLSTPAIYNISIDSKIATDETAQFWVDSIGASKAELYPAANYYFKRSAGSANASTSFSVRVDAKEDTSFDIVRTGDVNSFNGRIDVNRTPDGASITSDIWSSESYFRRFPKSLVDETYTVTIVSVQTHLGPGPFSSPTAMIPMDRAPMDGSAHYGVQRYVPNFLMAYQTGGVWKLKPNFYIWEGGGISAYEISPIGGFAPNDPTSTYDAFEYPSGNPIILTGAQLLMGGNPYDHIWRGNNPLEITDNVRSIVNDASANFGIMAVYIEHRSSSGVTWSAEDQSVLYYESWAGVEKKIQQPTIWTYEAVDAHATEPSFVDNSLIPAPDAPDGKYYSGLWHFNGSVHISGWRMYADNAGGWSNKGLTGYTIARPVITDNIGDVKFHVSGWASIL